MHVVARPAGCGRRGSQLDQEAEADDVAAEPLDEAGGGRGGAAGGQHVVDDQHPLAGVDARRGGSRAGRCRTRATYSSRATAHGSLPALRIGTNPAPSR